LAAFCLPRFRIRSNQPGGTPVTPFDPKEYSKIRGLGMPPFKQLLPEKYNRKSELILVLEKGGKTLTKDYLLTP